MKSLSNVAIVIVNYNGNENGYLKKFLPNVLEYSQDAQIFVIDNCSTDDSVSFLEKEMTSVQIIRLPKNKGYAGGYSIGLKKIKAEFYVLLNSDVYVTPDWLFLLISLLESDSKIAACQPKIKSYASREEFEYAGAAGGFIDKLGYPFCRGRIFSSLEKDFGQYDNVNRHEIFWASGACLAVKSDLYHEFGGLDSSFFMHMEEIDLCWRFKNAGYTIFYQGKSEVFHVGGGTLPPDNSTKVFYNFRNGLLLLANNLPSSKIFHRILFRLSLDIIAAIRFFLLGKVSLSSAIFKAHCAFYRKLPEVIQNRKNYSLKRYPKFKRRSKFDEMYSKSIVWSYFFLKKRRFSDLNFNKPHKENCSSQTSFRV